MHILCSLTYVTHAPDLAFPRFPSLLHHFICDTFLIFHWAKTCYMFIALCMILRKERKNQLLCEAPLVQLCARLVRNSKST